jgi:Concanavalin A-like lectin/glucanases superfamily
VLGDAPRAYWRLGEAAGAGTALNEVAGGVTGNYQSGVTLGVTGALVGDTNRAARFDGNNDQVNMGDPGSGALDFGTGDFSLEAWVKGTANNQRTIVSKQPSSGSSPYWLITVSDDEGFTGRVRARLFDGAVTRTAYGPATRVDNGAWHHVVVVFDRDVGITVYVDGVAATAAGAMTGSVSNTAGFLIGKSGNASFGQFAGDLDEVAVYPSTLSAAKVAAHRSRGLGI